MTSVIGTADRPDATRAVVLPGSRPSTARTRSGSTRSTAAIKWAVLVIAVAVAVAPILYLLATSFKSPDDILSTRMLPARLAVENWVSAMANWPIFTYLGNSLLVAAVAVVVALVIAVPANYAIARLGVGGSQTLLLIVSAYIAPPVVAIVPLFLLVRTAGLMNSPLGLGLVEGLMLTPVAVWLLDGFFRAIPEEIDEAAQLDGCGPVRTLVSVLMPLIVPGLVAVGIIVFILVYNDFLVPLLLTQSGDAQTLPVGIALMQGGREVMFGQMAAASLTGMVPVYLLALFAQRWLIGGLTQGSVK
ncbi:carbohydrate ABC transporter permease [Microbacterium halotolerans]|uniref:carbohydrate ABC transporter permease n=1 Tax=Microbacterium halotolerans TaxID=246613 RepID=UPI000E6ACDC0|nr:carbohydrate ABC transporter permease [Microbacterium halotolerans]